MKTNILKRIVKDVEAICKNEGIKAQCRYVNEAPEGAMYENIRIVSDDFEIQPAIFDSVYLYGYVTIDQFQQSTIIGVNLYCKCRKDGTIKSVRYCNLTYNIDTKAYLDDNADELQLI